MHKLKALFPQFLKNWYHLGQAVLANLMYGFPSRRIKVIGVTGTNGKTTTVQMITRILEESEKKVAMASTINFKLGEKEWVNATKYTTLSPFAVQKFIRQAMDAGCEYLVLETSSHSLDQYRVWGVDYHMAVITNVTREHLDYHRTMEKYRKAKLKLFQKAKVAIVNLDMINTGEFLQYNNAVKYGYTAQIENVNLKMENDNAKLKIIAAEKINLGIKNTSYVIQDTSYSLNLPGKFNVENALAATCVGLAENIDPETIARALAKIQGVPGRLENVPNDRGLNIMIDYAVTPDSLEKLYQLIDEIKNKKCHPELVSGSRDSGSESGMTDTMTCPKIISVFGSCGERDRGKRPMMGEIVSRTADFVIVTNEDPYHEDPMRIINEVFMGVIGSKELADSKEESRANFQFPISNFQTNSDDQNLKSQKIENTNCWRILDRREAIKKALTLAKAGDIILVTGKGAEEAMAVKGKMIPWNDKKVILEELGKM